MKKLLVVLVVLAMMVQVAFAIEFGEGLDAQIQSVSYETEEGNDTHTRISVNMTLTNWEVEPLELAEEIRSELVFAEKYSFYGDMCFEEDVIEPLVQLKGSVEFDVPNMVLATPEAVVLTIQVSNKNIVVALDEVSGHAKSAPAGKFECEGFSTPEEAALAYVQALKNQDVMSAVSTFAIETFVENVNFESYIERIWVFSALNLDFYVPVDNPYFTQVKVLRRLNSIVQNMSMGYMSQIWDESFGDDIYSQKIFNGDNIDRQIEEFKNTLVHNAEKFPIERMTIHGIADGTGIIEIPDQYYNENLIKNMSKQAVAYGCDELRDTTVHFSIDGVNYIQFMQCIRYGDRWFNCQPFGSLTSVMGIASATGGLIALEDAE